MVKSEKKRKDTRLKKHLHLNIQEELYDFAKEKGINASVLLENTLKRLRLGLGEEFETESADLVLISQKNSKNGLDSAASRVRTGDLGIMSPAP